MIPTPQPLKNVLQSFFIVSLVVYFFFQVMVYKSRIYCEKFQKNIRWYY